MSEPVKCVCGSKEPHFVPLSLGEAAATSGPEWLRNGTRDVLRAMLEEKAVEVANEIADFVYEAAKLDKRTSAPAKSNSFFENNLQCENCGNWAKLPAPPSEQGLTTWLIHHEDRDRAPLVFKADEANAAKALRAVRTSWNCHLFRLIECASGLDCDCAARSGK